MRKKSAGAAVFAAAFILSSCSLPPLPQKNTDSGNESAPETVFTEEITAAETEPAPVTDEVSETESPAPAESQEPVPAADWTEINYGKTMYTVAECTGYSIALPDGEAVMIYDPGYELWITARTSTGYYRTYDGCFIPCEFLDTYPPEDADTYSASCRPKGDE